MGIATSWYQDPREDIPEPVSEEEIVVPLSTEEKEDIARKRLAYLATKYPPTRPLDQTKRVNIPPKESAHEQYIKDVCS